MGSHLPPDPTDHHYVVAAVAVSTDRPADLGRSGFTGAEVEVRFAQIATGVLADPLEIGPGPWIGLLDHRDPPAWVHQEGRRALVGGLPATPEGHAAQIRRVVPFAAALQGQIILHAAAAVLGGGAVAFVGESGAGKTTLARALARAGAEVLADDLTPCVDQGGKLVVPRPGREDGRLDGVPLERIAFLSRRVGVAESRWNPLGGEAFLRGLLRHGFGELTASEVWRRQFQAYGRMVDACEGAALALPDDRGLVDRSAAEIVALLGRPGRDG